MLPRQSSKTFFNLLIICLLLLNSSCTKPNFYEKKFLVYGTILEFKFFQTPKNIADEAMANIIAQLNELNSIFHPWQNTVIKNFNNNGKNLFKIIAEKIFGKIINQNKEGTRNYAIKISNKIYWDLNKFKIFKKYKISRDKMINEKIFFKILNLEILYRHSVLKQKNFSFSLILSKIGYKYFYDKKN